MVRASDWPAVSEELRARYDYTLPGRPHYDRYLIPVSGGADSSALAIVLTALFPSVGFGYYFSDTKADDPAIYDTLRELESFLGVEVTRDVPAKGLEDLISQYGNFLPSGQARWCTRQLKLEPFEQHCRALLKGVPVGAALHAFVGIRADEPGRSGLVSQRDQIHTHLPFRAMGITRADVFGLLERTIGIPRLYYKRTRSGCYNCFAQRRSEWLGLAQLRPELFARAEGMETVAQGELERFNYDAVPLSEEVRLSANHLSFPVPARVDARSVDQPLRPVWQGKRQQSSNGELFEDWTDVWVGCEFMVHAGVGDHGVWWQSLVSFSTTRSGINRQLQSHFQHRLDTAEVMGLSQDEMRRELKLAVYRVALPQKLEGVMDKPGSDSYCWNESMSLRQLRAVHGWVCRSLHVAGLQQTIRNYQDAREGTWKAEQRAGFEQALSLVTHDAGEVLAMDRFDPKDIRREEDERTVVCFACSI